MQTADPLISYDAVTVLCSSSILLTHNTNLERKERKKERKKEENKHDIKDSPTASPQQLGTV